MKVPASVQALACDAPFVFSAEGYKSLYFTLDHLQSRMCCAQPTQLEVDYTRTMMGFLLFDSHPRHIAMIGLGGGSLLKFCYQHLPDAELTVVEINPAVIALQHEFEVPQDPQRIHMVCADGADFVRAAAHGSSRYDVLLVDGFDSRGLASSLCSQAFYNDCHASLARHGLIVANLHHDDPNYPLFTSRIRLAFDGHLFEVASQEKSNSIVFARRGQQISVETLRQSKPLEHFKAPVRAQLAEEFARITWRLSDA